MKSVIDLTQLQNYIDNPEDYAVNTKPEDHFIRNGVFLGVALISFLFAYDHYMHRDRETNYPLLFGLLFSALTYLSRGNKKYYGDSWNIYPLGMGICSGTAHALIEAAMTVEDNNGEDKLSKFNRYQYYLLKLKRLSSDELEHFLKNPLDRSYLEENTRHWLGSDPKNHANRKEKLITIANEISVLSARVRQYQGSQKDNDYFQLMSDNLSNDGGVKKSLVFSGVYNEMEIATLFNTIKATFIDFQHPLPIYLHNVRHAIAVVYYEKNFYLIDSSNERPSRKIDVDNLPQAIIQSLSTTNTDRTSEVICSFSTTIYCTGKNEVDFKQKTDLLQNSADFKKIHAITPKKATILTNDGLSWLMLAIENEEAKVVRELLQVRSNHQHLLSKFDLAGKIVEPDFMIAMKYHALPNEQMALIHALGLYKIKLIEIYDLFKDFKFLELIIQDPADADFARLTGLALPRHLNLYQPLHDLMIIMCIDIYIYMSWTRTGNIPSNIQKMIRILDGSDKSNVIQSVFNFSRNVLSNKSLDPLFFIDNALTTEEREFFHMIVDNEAAYIKNHQDVAEKIAHAPSFY